jgi:hypothetical protein
MSREALVRRRRSQIGVPERASKTRSVRATRVSDLAFGG